MKVSVFTPSHKPDHLPEVWACLQEQTYTDWEWVVVANGDQAPTVAACVEQLAAGDPRVVIFRSDATTVGGLKRTACEVASGELFMEYDHDDLITHDCIETVVAAAQACPKSCFIFSDDVTCEWNGQSHSFIKDFGWQQYDWSYKSVDYKINRQFPINARSLADILFAPDHVRVWSRTAYQLAGGHNPELRVGDDHELIVRTYIKGVHFQHIDRPLYIHRLKPDTTSQTSLKEIQLTSWNTRDRFLNDLIKEWCRREKLPMYDLGGAHNCPQAYAPIDLNPKVKDHPKGICCDIFQGITERDGTPMKPNSVGAFRASDFLEHVPADKVPALLNHLWDLLVPGGWLVTATPAVCDNEGRAGRGAFQDPTHKSYWSSNNWWYFSQRQFAKYDPEIRCRFQLIRLFNEYPSEWHRQHLLPYVFADLCAIKDDRYWPGPLEI